MTIGSHKGDEVFGSTLLNGHVRVRQMLLRDGGVEAAGIAGDDFLEASSEDLGYVSGSCTHVMGESPVIAVAFVIGPDAVVESRGVSWSVGEVVLPIKVCAPIEKTRIG